MSTSLTRSRHPLAGAVNGALALGLVRSLLARAVRAVETRRDMRLLSAAGDDMLRDIGLSRGEIESAVRYGRGNAPRERPPYRTGDGTGRPRAAVLLDGVALSRPQRRALPAPPLRGGRVR